MAASMNDQRDAALSQFLAMTEDRVDSDVAYSLLEAVGWDVQAATEQLYGGSATPRSQLGTTQPTLPSEASEVVDMTEDPAMSGVIDTSEEVERHPMSVDAQEDADAQLAAAIEASYSVQTVAGQEATEEEMMMKALQMSQAEEDSRQRKLLREQQEAELAESMLIDQHREQEQKRQHAAEEEVRKIAEQSRLEEEHLRQEAEQRVAAELQSKRARLPEEPEIGEPGRLQLMIRLPDGKRLKRCFRSSELVSVLYDFVDLQYQELAGQRYHIVSNMPRKAYDDQRLTLAESGIQNQFALMVEIVSGL